METSALVWSLALVGRHVWCGTERGPIAIYDRATRYQQPGPAFAPWKPLFARARLTVHGGHGRKLVSEARHHVGGVYCITPYPAYKAVWTGSNDFTCNM